MPPRRRTFVAYFRPWNVARVSSRRPPDKACGPAAFRATDGCGVQSQCRLGCRRARAWDDTRAADGGTPARAAAVGSTSARAPTSPQLPYLHNVGVRNGRLHGQLHGVAKQRPACSQLLGARRPALGSLIRHLHQLWRGCSGSAGRSMAELALLVTCRLEQMRTAKTSAQTICGMALLLCPLRLLQRRYRVPSNTVPVSRCEP